MLIFFNCNNLEFLNNFWTFGQTCNGSRRARCRTAPGSCSLSSLLSYWGYTEAVKLQPLKLLPPQIEKPLSRALTLKAQQPLHSTAPCCALAGWRTLRINILQTSNFLGGWNWVCRQRYYREASYSFWSGLACRLPTTIYYILAYNCRYFIYRIRAVRTPGFYFSKWVFGWGSI